MIRDSESETDVDMQTSSQNESNVNIISNIKISGLSIFLNLGEVSDNEVVSISDLNSIDPVRLDQGTEDYPELLNKEKKPRKKRRRACRNLTLTQNLDSETDTQDFSPSDGSDFAPDSASRFSDDSMQFTIT
ncbi:uncharacterized protein LOC125241916 isoform X1 [Leguminivora glycinivorella]|uniref:uncharacterized protein LOC125229643 isoform X1 n=1 Tax=Leguminivora glycinivorella TaxID=1035111 RepID=UPI00200BB698|nr:uncharacterized protein LOC125229643 isoform X1 [Leguminivora glycinivorella]XP_047990485.1 uncharacterized protein LOC125229643 isoform X1 [Leguminivora glycinivorella]XP_047994461.1 uncharacterized protein LOC125232740 isoform X1 [Leguminivora glycinivorella]XP_047994462.1 uncharacterized protein LOC125232740 isoform X1 [Leguminivora glycinivorella]XP_048005873.1 uncharacterized protein LOC125241426 isoform X1 [Leguminivora glycinivorella]XP_048005874.1 uncharacterized protein LOC12524142